jgi:hypothetical protein
MQGAGVGERGLQVDGGGAGDFPRILLTETLCSPLTDYWLNYKVSCLVDRPGSYKGEGGSNAEC